MEVEQYFAQPDDLAGVTFRNQLILINILKFVPLNDIRKWRLVSKLWNFVAAELLHSRQNATKKIDDLTGFLDTMKNRLESIPVYSAYNLVMAKISLVEIDRLSTELQNWVNVLKLDLLNSFEDTTKIQIWKSKALQILKKLPYIVKDTTEVQTPKSKTLQILKKFPNIVELRLEYDEDWDINYLTPADKLILPGYFPRLKFLYFKDTFNPNVVTCYFTAPSPSRGHRVQSTNLWNTILTRAQNLTRIRIECYHDAEVTATLNELLVTLTQFPNPPALALVMKLSLEPDLFQAQQFLQNCIQVGYRNLRVLDISSFVDLTPETVTIFNKFLNLQASSLESFKFSINAKPEHVKNILKLPPMPNLTFLEIIVNDWHLRRIRPRLTLKNFPKLDELRVQVKPYYEGRGIVNKNLKICGGNSSTF